MTIFKKFPIAALSLMLVSGLMSVDWRPINAYSVQYNTPLILKNVSYRSTPVIAQMILDLTSIPQDLEVHDPANGPMTLSFSGKLASPNKSVTKTFGFPNLQQIYYEERNGKIQVFVKRKIPKTATVSVDSATKKLTLSVPLEYTYRHESQIISPGIRHTRLEKLSNRGPLLINILEVDPKNPAVEITPALANAKMGAKARVIEIAHQNDAIAGINASFFKQDVGIPLGTLIIQEELISGPLYDRASLGISQNNDLTIQRIQLQGQITLEDGTIIPIHNLNQPRTQANEVVLYSSRWGKVAPAVPKGGYQIQIRSGRVTDLSRQKPLVIPEGGYVLSAPHTEEISRLVYLYRYAPMEMTFYTVPDWSQMKHAVGGGPYLVRNGQVYVDSKAQRFTTSSLGTFEPRSAAGITKEGRLLLVTVDGRQKNVSVGMSLTELAHLMLSLGATDAMNLDGGSSTQMVVKGQLVNSPSIPQGAAISSALLVRRSDFATAPLQSGPSLANAPDIQ